MAKSLDPADITVVRPAGTVSPDDYNRGVDDTDIHDIGGLDNGLDDNDFLI